MNSVLRFYKITQSACARELESHIPYPTFQIDVELCAHDHRAVVEPFRPAQLSYQGGEAKIGTNGCETNINDFRISCLVYTK